MWDCYLIHQSIWAKQPCPCIPSMYIARWPEFTELYFPNFVIHSLLYFSGPSNYYLSTRWQPCIRYLTIHSWLCNLSTMTNDLQSAHATVIPPSTLITDVIVGVPLWHQCWILLSITRGLCCRLGITHMLSVKRTVFVTLNFNDNMYN